MKGGCAMRAINIKWDTDGDEELLRELPTEIEIPKDVYEDFDENECQESISDWLTEQTGFCHFGFELFE